MELKKLLTVSACLILSASCSRKKETSNLTIQLPTFTTASHQISGKAGDVSASADGPPDWNTSLNPASSSDVNCYAVFVGGPEQNLKANKCFDFNAASGVVDPASIFRFGPHVGFIPAGGSVEVEVPSGSGRIVHLIGVKAQNGACTSFLGGGEPDFTNLSEPHVISRQVVDLAPGDVNLTMVAKIDANTKTFTECDFIKDSGGGGSGPILGKYGVGGESKTITTPGTVLEGGTGQFCDAASECGAYQRVSSITANGSDTDLTVASIAGFDVGDEVLVIVMDAFDSSLTHGPDGYCANSAGDAFVGAHSYHTIEAASASTVTVSGTSNLLSSIVPANLAAKSGASSYCYVQLVKVVNLDNLTISSGNKLEAPSLDLTADSGGGVIALRIDNTLSLSSGASISATGKGFAGGAAGQNGEGSVGGVGGRFLSGVGGGGGGHMGPTAFGQISGGKGGNAGGNTSGGGAVDEHCAPSHECNDFGKLICGGGGGAGPTSPTAGKNGGGIVILHARNINISGTGIVEAKGEFTSGTVSSNAGGGGAGGFIELFTESISGSILSVEVNGSDGQTADSAGAHGGGGGSGGFIAFGDVGTCSNVSPGFSGGAAGGGNGAGSNGFPGESGAFTKSFPCP